METGSSHGYPSGFPSVGLGKDRVRAWVRVRVRVRARVRVKVRVRIRAWVRVSRDKV